MSDGKKKLSFLTVISTIICVVFVCEAAAPAAAIGNQQFFWWIFLILTFLLPYGMVVAELGTTYDGEGGIYDWVRDGLGDKWGARISYYYWVNYPLWIASLATMFPDILGMVFGVEFNLIAKMGIDLAFVWIVYLMGRSKAADSEWVLNGRYRWRFGHLVCHGERFCERHVRCHLPARAHQHQRSRLPVDHHL